MMNKTSDVVIASPPDISADDSPRLKELCRLTAMEIKAVGGVGAATSLEMIGYIRELERANRSGADDYVAWCRYTYNSEGGIQSIQTCNSDAKGAFKVYSREAEHYAGRAKESD